MSKRLLRVGSLGVLLAVAIAFAALLPGATAEASEQAAGDYLLVLTCDTDSAKGDLFEFTKDDNGLGAISLPSGFECDAGGSAMAAVTATGTWNDFLFAYQCPKETPRLLDVPAPDAEVGVAYDLTCASPGATIMISSAVGGIAELAPLAETSAERAAAPVDGSGWSAGSYAALAGGLAAAAVALGGAAWYGRRRLLG